MDNTYADILWYINCNVKLNKIQMQCQDMTTLSWTPAGRCKGVRVYPLDSK